MNFQRIHYFLTFCHSLHFSNAAKELGISQPALAKAINKLEDELGSRLVRREGRNTHLTQQGRSAHKIFSTMMSHVYKVDEEIDKVLNQHHKQVRVAVCSCLDFSLLAKFLAAYHLVQPKVQIDIIDCEAGDCDELLLKGKVDCLITYDCESISESVCCIDLYRENWVLTGSRHTITNNKNLEIFAAASQKIAKLASVPRDVYALDHTFAEPVVKCKQQLWMQQLVKQGVGFGVVCDSSELIDSLGMVESDDILKTMTVRAAIPVGRNECKTTTEFCGMLKSYKWG